MGADDELWADLASVLEDLLMTWLLGEGERNKALPQASGVNHRRLKLPFPEIRNTGREIAFGGEINTAIWDKMGRDVYLDMKEKIQNKAESANRDFRSNVRAGDNILEFSIEMLFRARGTERNMNENNGKQETPGEPWDTLICKGCAKEDSEDPEKGQREPEGGPGGCEVRQDKESGCVKETETS